MTIENTAENRKLKKVAATMAIENMFPSEEFIRELMKVSAGEKTYDELEREVIMQYARQ